MREIVLAGRFKRDYKALSSEHKLRVQTAINDLSSAKDPRAVGVRKRGPMSELFAHEIGQDVRILYYVEGDTVTLLRVGTHKRVYQ